MLRCSCILWNNYIGPIPVAALLPLVVFSFFSSASTRKLISQNGMQCLRSLAVLSAKIWRRRSLRLWMQFSCRESTHVILMPSFVIELTCWCSLPPVLPLLPGWGTSSGFWNAWTCNCVWPWACKGQCATYIWCIEQFYFPFLWFECEQCHINIVNNVLHSPIPRHLNIVRFILAIFVDELTLKVCLCNKNIMCWTWLEEEVGDPHHLDHGVWEKSSLNDSGITWGCRKLQCRGTFAMTSWLQRNTIYSGL